MSPVLPQRFSSDTLFPNPTPIEALPLLLLMFRSLRAMRTRDRFHATPIVFAGLLFAFAALLPTPVFAQRSAETVDSAPDRTRETATATTAPKSEHTPVTTLENANGSIVLQSSEGGSFLAPGLDGAIPAEGAGARMMWYPAQAAFRAGEVGRFKDGSQWDADSIGSYSAAFGVDTKASGDLGAVAMGDETEATNVSATAMGFLTRASGPNAVAMGILSEANGASSLAVGFDAFAGNDYSLMAGRCNEALSSSLFEIGNGPLDSNGDACAEFNNALALAENGNVTIAGTLIENSDRRLKTDVEPLSVEVINALQEIDPVRFHFKDERTHPAGEQIGLIAQEVQNEFPELVGEGDDGMLSLSYTKFSAVLLKGLQEQQSTIETQQSQISDLKAENEEIKARLAALEARQSSSAVAGLVEPWGLALFLGLGGLAGGVLWRRRS